MIAKPKKLIVNKSSWKLFARLLSNNNENVLLADALNLLSPGSEVKNVSNYKPSLLNNLTKGSAQEQYQHHNIINYEMPSSSKTQKYLSNLLSDFRSSSLLNKSNSQLLTMGDKELTNYVKTVNNEDKLIEAVELFYCQDRLSFKLLAEILLNKHLKNLSRLPVSLLSLRSNEKISWSDINYTQFNIILLKKYYDLKKPLLIIKNLKDNFEKNYFPLIESNRLSPFYERIVWKFHFEYIKQFDELYYIKKLNNIKSTFLIWEGSFMNNYKITKFSLQHHKDLNVLQRKFLRVCSNELIQYKINNQLTMNNTYSKLLSDLKKISIKFKLYSLTDEVRNENNKLNYYLLISSLENIILNELIENKDGNNELVQILKEIKDFRQLNLMRLNQESKELNWECRDIVLMNKGYI